MGPVFLPTRTTLVLFHGVRMPRDEMRTDPPKHADGVATPEMRASTRPGIDAADKLLRKTPRAGAGVITPAGPARRESVGLTNMLVAGEGASTEKMPLPARGVIAIAPVAVEKLIELPTPGVTASAPEQVAMEKLEAPAVKEHERTRARGVAAPAGFGPLLLLTCTMLELLAREEVRTDPPTAAAAPMRTDGVAAPETHASARPGIKAADRLLTKTPHVEAGCGVMGSGLADGVAAPEMRAAARPGIDADEKLLTRTPRAEAGCGVIAPRGVLGPARNVSEPQGVGAADAERYMATGRTATGRLLERGGRGVMAPAGGARRGPGIGCRGSGPRGVARGAAEWERATTAPGTKAHGVAPGVARRVARGVAGCGRHVAHGHVGTAAPGAGTETEPARRKGTGAAAVEA